MNRIMLVGTFALACTLFVPTSSMASKEGVLAVGDLRITSQGIGESGPIEVTATRGTDGFSTLAIQAFGRTTKLTQAATCSTAWAVCQWRPAILRSWL
jgi:hypothetical protein